MVKEEKERLQMGRGSPASGEDWRLRDVVRTLEDQLQKERAKSLRSNGKRSKDHRVLLEQVRPASVLTAGLDARLIWCLTVFSLFGLSWRSSGHQSVLSRCESRLSPMNWRCFAEGETIKASLSSPPVSVSFVVITCSSLAAEDRPFKPVASP